jgi:cysteine desulfuration protein SufE
MPLADIIENFELLDDWEDRYRYLIELGRTLEPLDATAYSEETKVKGCASQVWIESRPGQTTAGAPALLLKGDSDAHIVRGLIALVIALYSGQSCEEIVATDAQPVFERLGLSQHLTPQRSNGVRAMVERIKRDAQLALA